MKRAWGVFFVIFAFTILFFAFSSNFINYLPFNSSIKNLIDPFLVIASFIFAVKIWVHIYRRSIGIVKLRNLSVSHTKKGHIYIIIILFLTYVFINISISIMKIPSREIIDVIMALIIFTIMSFIMLISLKNSFDYIPVEGYIAFFFFISALIIQSILFIFFSYFYLLYFLYGILWVSVFFSWIACGINLLYNAYFEGVLNE